MLRLPALLRRAFVKTVEAVTLPAPIKTDVIPQADIQWVAPTAITRLLSELAEKKTYWVFASDMQELKDRVDRWNAYAPQARQISMLIRSDVNDRLHQMMDDHLHAPAAAHDHSAEATQRYVGPHHLDGLRMCVGSTHIACEYVYNIMESYLRFTANDGERREAHFGLESEFQDRFTQLADNQNKAIKNPALNALPKKTP
ncbi:hypothetical protein [Micavibrio aeruginosavorus]|uniref:hypothetical protein n=1 Tax=Micavibrio aeruginosavorus TaxID=349221 RepID=UPI003F4ABCCC